MLFNFSDWIPRKNNIILNGCNQSHLELRDQNLKKEVKLKSCTVVADPTNS